MEKEKKTNLSWTLWWRLMRPHTLTAAVMPVLIGSSMAFAQGSFDFTLFLEMTAASVLIQGAVNMFNEYYDFKRGLDSHESVGIGGVLVRDELREKSVLHVAIVLFGVSVMLGLLICIRTSWWIAPIGAVSMVVGYFYSAGSHPIAHTRFGEAAAGICMGPVIVLIAYFIQCRTIALSAVLVSVPISILVSSILLANNIRDSERDQEKGRRTLAVAWGHDKGVEALNRFFVLSYVWTTGLVLFRLATPWTLLVFASVPRATRSIRLFKEGRTPVEMMPAMKATSELHTQFGILMSIGIILGRYLPIR